MCCLLHFRQFIIHDASCRELSDAYSLRQKDRDRDRERERGAGGKGDCNHVWGCKAAKCCIMPYVVC